jgi:hypothetical protein
MRTRERVAARFYKSSDRTHITKIRWTKRERAEWEQDCRDTAVRLLNHIENNDVRSAFAAMLHIEHLGAVGIGTMESRDACYEFMRRCMLRVEVKLEGNVQFKPECIA